MISVIQRVRSASVSVGGSVVGRIGAGLVSLTAVHAGDDGGDARQTAEKLLQLRLFPNGDKALDLDVTQVGGGVLLVPNFTVAADVHGGRRPALHPAASPPAGRVRFEELLALLRQRHGNVAAGVFGGDMLVTIENDGPVTVIFDTTRQKKPGRPMGDSPPTAPT